MRRVSDLIQDQRTQTSLKQSSSNCIAKEKKTKRRKQIIIVLLQYILDIEQEPSMLKVQQVQFEITSKSLQIKRYLRKAQTERMPFEVIEMAHIVRKISLFRRQCKNNNKDMTMLAVSLTSKATCAGDYIYKIGDPVEEMYVVVEGKVLLMKDDLTYEYGPGCYFGENQLLFQKDQRVSSAKCQSYCQLMVVKKKAFFVALQRQEQIQDTALFLEKCSYFEGINRFELEMLSTRIESRKYRAGEYILVSGSGILEHITWLVRGDAAVLREIDLDIDGRRIKKSFKIESMVENSSYGEMECLQELQPSVSIFCQTTVSVYQANFSEVVKMTDRWLKVFQARCAEYPSDDDILETYKMELAEDLYKYRLLEQMKSIKCDKQKYSQKKKQLEKYKDTQAQKPAMEQVLLGQLLKNLQIGNQR